MIFRLDRRTLFPTMLPFLTEIEIENGGFMSKKHKANKPLASALTVARPVKHAPEPSASVLSATSPQNVAEEKKAPLPKAPRALNTTFVLFEPHANRVHLSGEFNAWSPEATPLIRQADGHWETILALPPGRYEYKFIVDGHWIPDPNTLENALNPHGTLNSAIEVRA